MSVNNGCREIPQSSLYDDFLPLTKSIIFSVVVGLINQSFKFNQPDSTEKFLKIMIYGNSTNVINLLEKRVMRPLLGNEDSLNPLRKYSWKIIKGIKSVDEKIDDLFSNLIGIRSQSQIVKERELKTELTVTGAFKRELEINLTVIEIFRDSFRNVVKSQVNVQLCARVALVWFDLPDLRDAMGFKSTLKRGLLFTVVNVLVYIINRKFVVPLQIENPSNDRTTLQILTSPSP